MTTLVTFTGLDRATAYHLAWDREGWSAQPVRVVHDDGGVRVTTDVDAEPVSGSEVSSS